MKRLQNRIAESGYTLLVAIVYAVGVWLLSGLLAGRWWPQLVCYVVSVYMLVELSNTNALLRVRNRMVSTCFVFLTCLYPEAFASFTGCFTQMCIVATLLLLFRTYQDNQSVGRTFYAFLFLGLASMAYIQILWIVPVLWLLMGTQLLSFSMRNMFASLIGLATPYWFIMLWFIYLQDFGPLHSHFSQLFTIQFPYDYQTISTSQVLTFFTILALDITGIIHFWHKSYEDKIRIRLLFGVFTTLSLLSLLIIALQPQLFQPMISLAFVCSCPLLAHFLTLTSTRITNIAFFVIFIVCILVTGINLWTHWN